MPRPGSGVLGIAALLLGAERVCAVDNDPQALYATRENAERNGVADRLDVCAPDAVLPLRADLVIANILAGVLIELAPRLTALLGTGGMLVLSGILDRQVEAVQDAYRGAVDWRPGRRRDGWSLLIGDRR